MAGRLVVLSLLALAGCRDESPPRMEEVCVKEEFAFFIHAGQVQVPFFECTQTEMRCVAGKDYLGERKCS